MTAAEPELVRRARSAREHLAGVKAARAWQQDLLTEHLRELQADRPHTEPPPTRPDGPATGAVKP